MKLNELNSEHTIKKGFVPEMVHQKHVYVHRM